MYTCSKKKGAPIYYCKASNPRPQIRFRISGFISAVQSSFLQYIPPDLRRLLRTEERSGIRVRNQREKSGRHWW